MTFMTSLCSIGGTLMHLCACTVHVRNFQMLMIEVYRSLNHLNPSSLYELFARKEIKYNLRIKDILSSPKPLTTSFDINSISFKGSILWNSTPNAIKSSNTVFAFIKNIKTGLVMFAIVIFVHNFLTMHSCKFFLLVAIYWLCLVV